jgi:hypothetical protein
MSEIGNQCSYLINLKCEKEKVRIILLGNEVTVIVDSVER